MSKRELTLTLRAKNAMAAGLGRARASVEAFGKSAARIGSFFGKRFLAAGAAVVGFAAKAVSAYAVQERAERSLVTAINAHGEAGDALLPALKRIASAIQDETGVADEATLSGMAKMRMLGVQTRDMEKAAKATIALKSIGLEEAAAQKAVAMAMQGNYEMLNRYVPALRDTADETEKARIVNELFEKGYEQQAGTLDTVAGQWGALKGRVGDLWEEIGRAIVQNEGLMKVLKRAGEAVKAFGARVSDWVERGGVVRLIAGFKLFYQEVKYTFQLLGNSFKVTWAVLADGAETAFNYIGGVVKARIAVIVAEFRYLGDYAVAVWNKIKKPLRKFDPPDTSEIKEALAELASAAAGADAVVTERTKKALEERAKLHEEHAKKIAEISADETDAIIKNHDDQLKSAKKAAETEQKLTEDTSRARIHAEKKAATESLKNELKSVRDKKKAIEDLAKSRVQSLIDQRRADKDELEARAKDDERARRLAEKEERGVKLSAADKEFLEAHRDIQAAAKEFEKLGKAEAATESQIKAQEEALKVQEEMKTSLEHIETKMDQVLTYSE